jgi:hypothetical protein
MYNSKWRSAFDRHAGAQKSAGLTNPRVFRSADDKNELVILFDTKDTTRAKADARAAKPIQGNGSSD